MEGCPNIISAALLNGRTNVTGWRLWQSGGVALVDHEDYMFVTLENTVKLSS